MNDTIGIEIWEFLESGSYVPLFQVLRDLHGDKFFLPDRLDEGFIKVDKLTFGSYWFNGKFGLQDKVFIRLFADKYKVGLTESLALIGDVANPRAMDKFKIEKSPRKSMCKALLKFDTLFSQSFGLGPNLDKTGLIT